MEFQCDTVYHQAAMTTMARALRKTVRKKKSRRSHILVIILVFLLTLPLGEKELVIHFKRVITWIMAVILLLTLIFEDTINGYIARKRMLPGLEKATVTFHADGYHSETELGSSDFKYDTIISLAETDAFFVFLFSQNHAQVYNKNTITGGTIDEFRAFLKHATGKEIQKI